ncbi:isochorismatase domain-containing protein 2 [Folsomia candida]|uniref:Isochorismatase domain-containing protein 2, mitochondrial n=1 Tax=Folsomia candida TaxID=158441 RepID=A0A226E125_FOLCA|nr:isochorismatase domain-containing protein 2 [Folsomia candida]OXA50677.1 Isochorismatase domain-containing protein 2, mitochondrial [Folsomia candida]
MAAGMVGRLSGKLIPKNSSLFLCDMQDKFRPSIKYFDAIVSNSGRLLRAASILDMPVVCTEQYPQGLGKTVPELGIEAYGIKALDKTLFSMCLSPVVEQLKKTPDVNSIILCGIEAHVCIQQTALDLKNLGYEVFVVADACSSRGHVERKYAFSLLKQAGCWLTTTESAILALAGGSAHPRFKELQALIKQEGPDTGLMDLNI